jgi:hypothetical protein
LIVYLVPFLEDHVSKYEMERKNLWVYKGKSRICITVKVVANSVGTKSVVRGTLRF